MVRLGSYCKDVCVSACNTRKRRKGDCAQPARPAARPAPAAPRPTCSPSIKAAASWLMELRGAGCSTGSSTGDTPRRRHANASSLAVTCVCMPEGAARCGTRPTLHRDGQGVGATTQCIRVCPGGANSAARPRNRGERGGGPLAMAHKRFVILPPASHKFCLRCAYGHEATKPAAKTATHIAGRGPGGLPLSNLALHPEQACRQPRSRPCRSRLFERTSLAGYNTAGGASRASYAWMSAGREKPRPWSGAEAGTTGQARTSSRAGQPCHAPWVSLAATGSGRSTWGTCTGAGAGRPRALAGNQLCGQPCISWLCAVLGEAHTHTHIARCAKGALPRQPPASGAPRSLTSRNSCGGGVQRPEPHGTIPAPRRRRPRPRPARATCLCALRDDALGEGGGAVAPHQLGRAQAAGRVGQQPHPQVGHQVFAAGGIGHCLTRHSTAQRTRRGGGGAGRLRP